MTAGWDARWLDLVEQSPAFDELALRRGADYAGFDWQLDVEIESGRASTLATSGRMQYEASIEVPVMTPERITSIVDSVAAQTQRIAAVLDGELPADLELLADLDPARIQTSCTCTSVDRPCKHAAAIAHLVADAIADDPFDLLHLRGLSRAGLIERLTQIRRGAGSTSPTDATDATRETNADPNPAAESVGPELSWSEGDGDLPPDLAPPDSAGSLPPFPTPPPPGASFDEAGLRTLADDAARRAHDLLTGKGAEWVDLDPTADLARRAAELENSDRWKALVERAQVTSQELRARAAAWRAGGAAAVEAHVAPTESVSDPDKPDRQYRRTSDRQWVRFDKQKGRWLAVGIVSGPPTKHSVDRTEVDRPTSERQ